jgi:SOS response associated peptidase (SRAP)
VQQGREVISVHGWMPLILNPDNYELWLDPGKTNVAAASELLKPFDARLMRCFPVEHADQSPSGCRRFSSGLCKGIHCLGQLCIHFVRDDHDIGQQQVEIQRAQIHMQGSENGHLKDS